MTADAGPGGPGHGSKGSNPAHGRDFGDFVRIALNAAADQIEPCTDGPEGLIPIRARILARAGRPLAAGVRPEQILAGPEVSA